MTKSNSTPKRKRTSMPPIASATRRILKKKPDGVASWSDRLVEKLLTIATNPKTPAATAMQAIRILIEHSGSASQANDLADFSHESDGPSVAELRSKSKEELDKYIAELMTTIGSIPGVKAPETPAAE
ncbi:MAG TPA: hypothetical protein VN579_06635 [Bryobacteraceae bacterium]|nr:hypothetical protein [Bryobacteraceae bacterium]